jgi:hypothetical protein
MEEIKKIRTVDPRKSFFNRAAWGSLLIPLVTVPTALSFLSITRPAGHSLDIFLIGALCFQVVSLLLGITALFGISWYGAKFILWKAVGGILASVAVGLGLFWLAMLNAMGNNC